MKRHVLLAAFALSMALGASAQVPGAGHDSTNTFASRRSENASRPILMRRQGRAFAYSYPQGWRVNETSNGIDISAPDGLTGVTASIVFGMFGAESPEGYLRKVLATLPLTDVRFEKEAPTPSTPGPYGLQWRGIEAEFTAKSKGRPIHVRAITHVLQGNGQYFAIMTGIQGPAHQWNSLKNWLPQVRDSIVLTNVAGPAGSMSKGLPKGIRHDDVYGSYNKGWTARGVPSAQVSAARREGTMGYTRQKDPVTGQIYDVPLDAYNASRGGYVNPVRPTELLVQTLD